MSQSANYLLVPITIEALVVGEADCNETWATASMDYAQSAYLLDPDPGPAASAARPEGGVHLHWALPDALSHGFQNEKGGIDFPCIPNRWLVVRLAPTTSPQAWVVESDYLNAQLGSNSFPKHDQPGAPTRIGRSVEADKWTEPGGKPWLTAIGPGEATFTAFYPKVRNVLGFHDTSDQLKPISQGPVSYMVTGWYSDPSGDPISPESRDSDGKRWCQFIEHCGWSLDGMPLKDFFADTCGAAGSVIPPQGAIQPTQILCHGLIHAVPWNGYDDQSYITPPPDSIRVAAGNTAAEAIAALIESRLSAGSDTSESSRQVKHLVQALQYQLIGQPDDQNGAYDRAIHAARFAAHPGGSYWLVTKKADQAPLSNGPTEPVLTDEQQTLLGELNEAQQRLDALQRQYASLQRDLYILWWKYRYDDLSPYGKPDRFKYNELIDAVKKEMRGLLQTIATTAVGVDEKSEGSKRKRLEDLLDKSELQLERKSMPHFWLANDPIVLVEGAGRSYKHGEDGRFSATNELLCRHAGDVISTINLPANYPPGRVTSTPVPGQGLTLDIPPGPLGEVINALAAEAFLLDPNNAQTLADTASKMGSPITIDAQQVAKQQTLFWNAVLYPQIFNLKTLQEQSGFNGVIPSPAGVQQWKSPWSPLYLDWMIRWVPVYGQSVNIEDLENGLKSWKLEDNNEYIWSPQPEPPLETPPANQFKGRALLTPQVTLGLQTSLAVLLQNVETDPENADNYLDPKYQPDGSVLLPDLIATVKNWDIISQALNSFTDQLTQRHFAILPLPDDPDDPDIADLLGKSLDPTQSNAHLAIPQPSFSFLPIRAGRLLIDHLQIVDSFGHATYVEHANALVSRDGSFIPPDSTLDDGVSLYLPPRLSQPARLMFGMMCANDDTRDTLAYPGDSPICGWVLPLYLDEAIAVYDAQGRALGQLLTIQENTTTSVHWEPAPYNGAAYAQDIKNDHLRHFVLSLLQQGTSDGLVLKNLLDVIDETLWAVDPETEKGSEAMSVLFGQPLALVRAQMQLELKGQPIRDLQWSATDHREETHSWTGVHFPVHLGDLEDKTDGLIGFFQDSELSGEIYQHFHAVYPAEEIITSAFITGDHSVPVQPQFCDKDGDLPPGEKLILLLDPRGGINVVSGILPAQNIKLPAEFVQNALAAMQVIFRTGPVLGDGIHLCLPLPAQSRGRWSWIHADGTTPEATIEESINKVDDRARLADAPLQIIEGWLKLSGALGKDK
jgi:hypothetical protein